MPAIFNILLQFRTKTLDPACGSRLASRSSITRLVDQLSKQGFLTRKVDLDDRRGSYAVLTKEGETALRDSWPHYCDAIQRHFGSILSDDEVQAIVAAFRRVHAALDNSQA